MKKAAIFGGSGFIGSAVGEFLRKEGWEVLVFQRKSPDQPYFWDPAKGILDKKGLDDCPYLINLAGESIIGFWTEKKKRAIRESRVLATSLISKTLAGKDRVLIQASATGIYGDRGEEIDESAARGKGFLAEVCEAWERETALMRNSGGRVAILRFGVVLDKKGGALQKMLFPFRLGLGGRLGSGKQWMSWIALEDLVRAIYFLMNKKEAEGIYNVVAPNPVTNQEFTETLAEVMNRPHFMSVPAFVLKMVLPGMAEEVFLTSLRAMPKRLEEEGFKFEYPLLLPFLEHSEK
jgi:uncharacterized protein